MSSLQRAILLFSFLSLFCGTLGEDSSQAPPNRCETYCSKSFPPHTYPNPDDHSACSRGCRLAQLESFLSYAEERHEATTTASCNDTCTKAYPSAEQLKFSCQVGCSARPLGVNIPDESVWILNTLYELSFLKKLTAQLQWTAQTAVKQPVQNPSSSLVLVNLDQAEAAIPLFSGSELTVLLGDEEGNRIISYKEVHYSSLQFVQEDVGQSQDLASPPPLFGMTCSDWESVFDFLIVVFIILFFLALLDHLYLPKKNTPDKKEPVVPVFNDTEYRTKKPVYVQDSNRYTYAPPRKEKFVEGTLVVINNKH